VPEKFMQMGPGTGFRGLAIISRSHS